MAVCVVHVVRCNGRYPESHAHVGYDVVPLVVSRHTVMRELEEETVPEDLPKSRRSIESTEKIAFRCAPGHCPLPAPGQGHEISIACSLLEIPVCIPRRILAPAVLAPRHEPTDRPVSGRVRSEQHEMIRFGLISRLRTMHPPDATTAGDVICSGDRHRLRRWLHHRSNIGIIPSAFASQEPHLGAVDDRQTDRTCMGMDLDGTSKPVVVGDCECFVPELRCARHQFTRPGCSVEEGIVRVAVQLCVARHSAMLIEHTFDTGTVHHLRLHQHRTNLWGSWTTCLGTQLKERHSS